MRRNWFHAKIPSQWAGFSEPDIFLPQPVRLRNQAAFFPIRVAGAPKFYRLASGFPTKSGPLLPAKQGRMLPTPAPVSYAPRFDAHLPNTLPHPGRFGTAPGSVLYPVKPLEADHLQNMAHRFKRPLAAFPFLLDIFRSIVYNLT